MIKLYFPVEFTPCMSTLITHPAKVRWPFIIVKTNLFQYFWYREVGISIFPGKDCLAKRFRRWASLVFAKLLIFRSMIVLVVQDGFFWSWLLFRKYTKSPFISVDYTVENIPEKNKHYNRRSFLPNGKNVDLPLTNLYENFRNLWNVCFSASNSRH